MKSPVHLELIFPIKDTPSAFFMSCKACCLRDVGVITESEKQWVDARSPICLGRRNDNRSLMALRRGNICKRKSLWYQGMTQ